MKHLATLPKHTSYLAALIAAALLTGCSDAETNIVEKDPIEAPGDGDDHDLDDDDHDHGDEYTIDSLGRLAVLSAESNEAAIFDLDDNALLDTFSLTYEGSSLTSSAGFRYAVIANRAEDVIEFIDGGLWREDHVEHLHDYEEAPAFTDYTLTGSAPTHVVKHDGAMAVFFDGNADANLPASVTVLGDNDITAERAELPMVEYAVNMHGVAEPRGEHLLATIRRDDAQTTSANPILPDTVAVFHLHDGEYEQEQTLETTCPDLHGAAQNEEFVVFGCSDGVLVAEQNGDEYTSFKIDNIDALNGLRVGSLYGHHERDTFVGVASQHGGGAAVLVNVHPHDSEMEEIDWQPAEGAHAVSYAFTLEGEHFVILDDTGFLTIMSYHSDDDHNHWEVTARVDISEEDVSAMPEGQQFSMAVSQYAGVVYVADPLANHVVSVDLESASIEEHVELDFAPKAISWLGIAESDHDH